ncbi:MAG: DUF2341 domain-containing protein [Candidatus Aenigmatarchaeota archaeon]
MNIKRLAIGAVILLFLLSLYRYHKIISYMDQLQFRQEINVTLLQSISEGSVLRLFIDTESLISSGKINVDCRDIEFALIDGDNEIILPKLIFNCGSKQTEVWIKVNKNVSAGETIRLYMYYGNPYYKFREYYDKFSDVSIFVGRYFLENRLNNTRYIPVLDILPQYWLSAGRRTFSGFGSTFVCPSSTITGCTYINIVPYEIGGEGNRLYTVSFSQGESIVVYKDLLPTNLAENAVLRKVFLPSSNRNYSIVRHGIHGSPDISSKLNVVSFTCLGRSYRYIFISEAGTETGPANTILFMFCVNQSNVNRYSHILDTKVSYIQETYSNASGLCVAYIAPTNNPSGDTNIASFLCSEIQYFETFAGRYFKVDNMRNILAFNITNFPEITIVFGEEERVVSEPKSYGKLEVATSDSYERGEEIVIYVTSKDNNRLDNVYLDILNYNGETVYGPVEMQRISSNLFSYKIDSSIFPIGVYLIRAYAYSDINIYAGIKSIKIHQKFSEIRETILSEAESIKQYLHTYIYPKILKIEENIDTLKEISYSNLVSIKDSLNEIRVQLSDIQSDVLFMNYTLYREIISIRDNIDVLLEKVNNILNILQTEFSYKVDSMKDKLEDIEMILNEVNNTLDRRIYPTVYMIYENIGEVKEILVNFKESSYEKYNDILFYLNIIEAKVDANIVYFDEIQKYLRCEDNVESSVCNNIRYAIQKLGEIKTEVIETKTLLQNLEEYVKVTLTNKIDTIYNTVSEILNEQVRQYNLLAENYNEVIRIKEFITELKQEMLDTKTEILAFLIRNEEKLLVIENRLGEVINEIRQVVIPKIDEASLKLGEAIEMLKNITGVLDIQYCGDRLCSKIDEILYELYKINNDIKEIKTSIEAISPVRIDIKQIKERLSEIYLEIDAIFDETSKYNTEIIEIKNKIEEVKKLIGEVYSELEGRQTYPGVQAIFPISPATVGVIAIIFVILLLAYLIIRTRFKQ